MGTKTGKNMVSLIGQSNNHRSMQKKCFFLQKSLKLPLWPPGLKLQYFNLLASTKGSKIIMKE